MPSKSPGLQLRLLGTLAGAVIGVIVGVLLVCSLFGTPRIAGFAFFTGFGLFTIGGGTYPQVAIGVLQAIGRTIIGVIFYR